MEPRADRRPVAPRRRVAERSLRPPEPERRRVVLRFDPVFCHRLCESNHRAPFVALQPRRAEDVDRMADDCAGSLGIACLDGQEADLELDEPDQASRGGGACKPARPLNLRARKGQVSGVPGGDARSRESSTSRSVRSLGSRSASKSPRGAPRGRAERRTPRRARAAHRRSRRAPRCSARKCRSPRGRQVSAGPRVVVSSHRAVRQRDLDPRRQPAVRLASGLATSGRRGRGPQPRPAHTQRASPRASPRTRVAPGVEPEGRMHAHLQSIGLPTKLRGRGLQTGRSSLQSINIPHGRQRCPGSGPSCSM